LEIEPGAFWRIAVHCRRAVLHQQPSPEKVRDAVLSILATIAKQERVRLSERVHAGLAKARRAGRIGGRRSLVVDRDRLAQLDEEGLTTGEIAEELGISAASVSRLLKNHRRPRNPAAGL
jgi:DNA invertase Pin-like site-specific DNA recombinase